MLQSFETLLQRTMGLGAASIGSAAVERAVRARMAARGLPTLEAYWNAVQAGEGELQELIDAVVVSETWFFRDREAFQALVTHIGKETAHPGAWRLLSLPCSTGEEPYSMAMALLDGGLAPERFLVDAVDISGPALERARAADYGRNSFRGTELGFRQRHFVPSERGHRLSEEVRRQVRFLQGNLFDPSFLLGAEPYDVIFCRNLLIYFDAPEQSRAIAVLSRLLSARGRLFVGPSETALLLAHGFASARIPLAFAFHKEPAKPRREAAAVVRARAPAPPTPPAPRPFAAPAPARAPTAPAPGVLIEDIARLADGGHLVEAARACEDHIRACGPSAAALYLLGLIRDSAGSVDDAVACYRKAIYLDPEHAEALAHLTYLLEKQGDLAGSRVLQNRLARLDQRARP